MWETKRRLGGGGGKAGEGGDRFGTSKWETERRRSGDESGEVLVWDWSNNSMVRVVTLVRLVGTVMSLAWDME